jgi:hypothetical protein
MLPGPVAALPCGIHPGRYLYCSRPDLAYFATVRYAMGTQQIQ